MSLYIVSIEYNGAYGFNNGDPIHSVFWSVPATSSLDKAKEFVEQSLESDDPEWFDIFWLRIFEITDGVVPLLVAEGGWDVNDNWRWDEWEEEESE